jgi:inhibitor of cysteine peptidase
MTTISQADNDRTVAVDVGDTVRVNLPENATTGYRWAIDHCDREMIEPLSAQAEYTSGTVGSGGDAMFEFRAKKAGTTEIALKYWRHWEGDASVANRFRVRLQVRS